MALRGTLAGPNTTQGLRTQAYPRSMPTTVQILDRLAADGRISADWVGGLRGADDRIDSKIEGCLGRVAAAGPYLPLEQEANSVIWRAFELPLREVRVVILGQDPYPNELRAVGLSFSTGPGGDVPASLANIYKEFASMEGAIPESGDLTPWTAQGVLLLNTALTLPWGHVAKPKRHLTLWKPLAIATMKAIRVQAVERPIAALLWGVPAHTMGKHLQPGVAVYATSHPSRMSAGRPAAGTRAFRGSDPFGWVNRYLLSQGAEPIDWNLPTSS